MGFRPTSIGLNQNDRKTHSLNMKTLTPLSRFTRQRKAKIVKKSAKLRFEKRAIIKLQMPQKF